MNILEKKLIITQESEYLYWFTLKDLNNLDIAFDYKQIIINEISK